MLREGGISLCYWGYHADWMCHFCKAYNILAAHSLGNVIIESFDTEGKYNVAFETTNDVLVSENKEVDVTICYLT